MKRLIAFGGAAMLGVLFLGCRLPPFDEGLSLAMITAAKLEPVVKIGPIQAWHGDFEGTDSYFLPFKDTPASRNGFVLSASAYYLRVRYLDGNGGSFLGEVRFEGPAADPNRKTYTAVPLKGGEYLSLALFDPTNSANNSLVLVYVSPPNVTNTVANLYGTFIPDFSSGLDRIAGVHLSPIDATTERFNFFAVLNTAGHFGEVEADVVLTNDGGIGTISLDPLRQDMALPSLPKLGSGAFYYHRPVTPNTSYLSCYDASTGDFRNFAWDDTLRLREMTGMKGRIDALLSSGELLSLAHGSCYVYDAGGGFKYSFPMGGLHFCFEGYDAAGVARLYFSLLYWIYGYQSGSDKLYIEIYSLPTAKLGTLN
jgi:hypothetical protein